MTQIKALLLINHPSVPVGTVTKIPKFNELSKTLRQQGVLLQLLITGTVSGAAISGVFADINNIAFESGVSQVFIRKQDFKNGIFES